MADNDGFLMRDSLTDRGEAHAGDHPYYSPDVIAHDQVENPQGYFTGNYDSDPNQPVELGTRLNPVYVRARNLGRTRRAGRIAVFRSDTSLFMQADQWRNNPLRTLSGATSVTLPVLEAGSVGVGQDHFVLNAIDRDLFCCVGIAGDDPWAKIPRDFTTYGDYLMWVNGDPACCCRNFAILRSYRDRSYERLDTFSNPSPDAVPTLFTVSVSGDLPDGTRFGLQCEPLGMDCAWPTAQGNRLQKVPTSTPGDFSGHVTTWVTLPAGKQWPAGASVETCVLVGVRNTEPAARFRIPMASLGVGCADIEGMTDDHSLVRLGNCLTVLRARDV